MAMGGSGPCMKKCVGNQSHNVRSFREKHEKSGELPSLCMSDLLRKSALSWESMLKLHQHVDPFFASQH